jgi:DNA transposition AAA+ family ATPase
MEFVRGTHNAFKMSAHASSSIAQNARRFVYKHLDVITYLHTNTPLNMKLRTLVTADLLA